MLTEDGVRFGEVGSEVVFLRGAQILTYSLVSSFGRRSQQLDWGVNNKTSFVLRTLMEHGV